MQQSRCMIFDIETAYQKGEIKMDMAMLFYRVRWFFAVTLGPARLWRLFIFKRSREQESLSRKDYYIVMVFLTLLTAFCGILAVLTCGQLIVQGRPLIELYNPWVAGGAILMCFWCLAQMLRAALRRSQNAGIPNWLSWSLMMAPFITLMMMDSNQWERTIGKPLAAVQLIWLALIIVIPTDGFTRLMELAREDAGQIRKLGVKEWFKESFRSGAAKNRSEPPASA